MIYKKYIFLLFILSVVFISSCYRRKKLTNTKKIRIELDNPISETTIDSIFDSIELVQLETTDKTVLAGCDKLIYYNDKYYIYDRKQNIVAVFNDSGKYIFSTKKLKGDGPNEYHSITDFIVKRNVGNIEVLDAGDQCIIEYSIEGRFINKFYLNRKLLPLSMFYKLSDDIYAFYSTSVISNNKSIIIYSLNEKKILKRMGYLNPNTRYIPKTNQNPFYTLDDTVFFNYNFHSNLIYSIDPSDYNLLVKYELDFGKHTFYLENLPDNKTKSFYRRFYENNNDKYAFVMSKAENKGTIFIHIYYKNDLYAIIYNKVNDKIMIIKNKRKKYKQLMPSNFLDERYYYYVVEPVFLKYVISNNLIEEKSKKIIEKIKINSNPIIIKYQIKQHR